MNFYIRTKVAISKGFKISYAQSNIHSYRFFVDSRGLMYFDDQFLHSNPKNLIKDRKFIQKFYSSIRKNDNSFVDNYPYVGQFWGQCNYLRYSSAPIVFNALQNGQLIFSMNLALKFQPQKLFLSKEAKLSYPFSSQFCVLNGEFSSQLLTRLQQNIEATTSGYKLIYQGKEYCLSQQ